MRSARRFALTSLVAAGLVTIGCATLIGLPDENSDTPAQGNPADASLDGDVSQQDAADSAKDDGNAGKDVSNDVPDGGKDSGKDADASTQDVDDAGVDATDELDGTTVEADAPEDGPEQDTGPLDAGDILKLASGVFHSCVIRTDGDGGTRTDCWGYNNSGALGRGSNTGSEPPGAVVEPMTSQPIRTLIDIAAGDTFTCAIDDLHDLYCWGVNNVGQLGIGSQAPKFRPFKVPSLSNVQKVVLGNTTAMAYGSNGVTSWWGESMLDPGAAYEAKIFQTAPLATDPALGTWKALSSSNSHACLLNPNGEVYCWGRNDSLECSTDTAGCAVCTQLPDGGGKSMTCYKDPTKVLGLAVSDAVELRTGYAVTCILRSNHDVWCWGDGNTGQLGARLDQAVQACGESGLVPDYVPDGVGFATIAVGYEQVCGVKVADGSVWCWGSSNYKTLGNNGGGASATPVPVVVQGGAQLKGMDLISARGAATCAARESSPPAVYCWGENGGNYAWLMDGSSDDLPVATPIPLPAMQ